MTPFWLRRFRRPPVANPIRRKPLPTASRRGPLLTFSELEDRTAPATITWQGGANSSWMTAANWVGGVLPGPADDVVIPDMGAAGTTTTISLNSTASVNSISSQEHLTINPGNLTVAGAISVTGNLNVTNSTLTAHGPITVNESGTNFGNFIMGGSAKVTFTSAATMTVQGTVSINAGTGSFSAAGPISVGTSFSLGTILSFSSGSITTGSTATFNAPATITGNVTTGSNVTVYDPVTITGTVTTAAGFYVTATGNLTAGAVIAGGQANIYGVTTITGNAAFNFSSTLYNTTVTGPNGVLSVGGTTTNAGTLFYVQSGGALRNMTLPVGEKIVANVSAVFDNVTVPATTTIQVEGGNDAATVVNGMVLNGTLNVLSASSTTSSFPESTLNFSGTQTISGTGTINLGTDTVTTLTNATQIPVHFLGSGTTTFGPGITTVAGRVLIDGPTATWVNQGKLNFTVPPTVAGTPISTIEVGTFRLDPTGVYRMGSGFSGQQLRIYSPTVDNAGTILVEGGTLSIESTTYLGTGTLSVAASTLLVVSGNATTLGTLVNTGGTIRYYGTLDNTGRTLTLDDTTGSLDLYGTILGGMINTSGSATLRIGSSSVLDGVTVNGTITIVAGTLTIRNGLTINGTLDGAGIRTIRFEAPATTTSAQTLGGTATVTGVLTQSVLAGNEQTVTIGAGITFTRGTIGATATASNEKWVLLGTTTSDSATTPVTVNASEFVHTGTMRVQNGGTLTVTVGSGWVNTNGLFLNPLPATATDTSVLNFRGTFLYAQIGMVTRNGGTRRIAGTLLNAGLDFPIDATTGPWDLAATGTIQGGTVTQTGATMFTSNASATLDGVTTLTGTVTGGVSVRNSLALNAVTITGGITFVHTGPSPSAQSLTGTGTIQGIMGQTVTAPSEQTVTVGSTITTTGGFSGPGTHAKFVFYGTMNVSIAAVGTKYASNGGDFTNRGVITVENGALLSMGPGAWRNEGLIRINPTTANAGTSFYLNGSFTNAGIGTITRNGGSVFLGGTLTNTGATLNLPSQLKGPIILSGEIIGGRVESPNPGDLIISGVTATFNGVTLAGSAAANSDWAAGGTGTFRIRNGLILDAATLTVTAICDLIFDGTGAGTATNQITGTGTVTHGTVSQVGAVMSQLVGATDVQTAGFGPGVTYTSIAGLTVGATGQAARQKWKWDGPATIGGTANAIVGDFRNTGVLTMTGVVSITGEPFVNTGTVVVNGGSLTFLGTATPATWGTFQQLNGAAVVLSATVTGGLTLTNALVGGDLRLTGATFSGGTIAAAPGTTARMLLASPTSSRTTLDGTTLATPFVLTGTSANYLRITNGLTLNTSQSLANANVDFLGTQTVGTTTGGEFVQDGTISSSITVDNTNTLTIAPGVTIRSRSGTLNLGSSGAKPMINRGTIRADGSNAVVNFGLGTGGQNYGLVEATVPSAQVNFDNLPSGWVNRGVLMARGGGTVGIATTSVTWTNLGQVVLSGGTFVLSGTVTAASLGNLTGDATSSVLLNGGTYSGPLVLSTAGPRWKMAGGTLSGATVTSPDGAVLGRDGTVLSYGAWSNVTLDVDFDSRTSLTPTGNGSLTVIGGQYSRTVGLYATLMTVNGFAPTLSGTGNLYFENGQISVTGNSTVVTIDRDLTLSGSFATTTSGVLINRGTIAATHSGGVTIQTPQFENPGTVRVGPNGTLLVSSTNQTYFSPMTAIDGFARYALNGGTWDVGASATLNFRYGNGTTTPTAFRLGTINADVRLDGGASRVLSSVSTSITNDALNDLATVAAGGRLTLTNGRTLATKNDIANAGAVELGTGATLTQRDGLVSHLPFQNSLADSGFTTISSTTGTVAYTTGVTGNAINFNGTGHIYYQDSAYQRLQAFTISMYIRPHSVTSGSPTQVLAERQVGSSNPTTGGFGLVISQTLGVYGWINSYNTKFGGAVVSATAWTHIVLSYDGSYLRLYQDGTHVSTSYHGGPIIHSATAKMTLGGTATTTNRYRGSMDEFKLYERVLTPQQILGTATFPQTYTQSSGTTTISGGTLLAGPSSSTVQLLGGTLSGAGTVNAHLVNIGGTVAPGNSPGFLDVTGDYTQGAAGTLALEIAGRSVAVPEFDRLRVTGTTTLDGTVSVSLLDDFRPSTGEEYRVLTSALRGGSFAVHTMPPVGVARRLDPLYDATGLSFVTQVVPPLEFLAATTAADGSVAGGQMVPRDVALDSEGNAYVVGSFAGTVDFDREHVVAGDTLTSTGTDGFLAKYDATGQLAWVVRLDGGTRAGALGLAVDKRGTPTAADDRVYVTGDFAGGVDYVLNGLSQGVTAGPGMGTHGFVLRADAAGNRTGIRAMTNAGGAAESTTGRRVAVTASGDVVVAGSFNAASDFNTGGVTAQQTPAGGTDAFVAQYDANLVALRTARLGGTGNDDGADVATDGAGNVWLTGSYEGTTTGLAALTSAGGTDAFLLKLTPSGTTFGVTVARSYGDAGDDVGSAVAVDATGAVLVGGHFEQDVDFDAAPDKAFTLASGGEADLFTLKLDAADEFVWARGVGGYRNESLADLVVDPAGNVYATGSFADRVDFDPLDGSYLLSTAPDPGPQAFVSKLDSAGRFGWAAQFGSAVGSRSSGAGIAVDAAGRVVSVGTFRNAADFDPGEDEQLRSYAATDPSAVAGYLSLLRQKVAPTGSISGLPPAPVSAGATIALTAVATDPDSTNLSYAWTVTRDGTTVASSDSLAQSFAANEPGTYAVSLSVTDETGNVHVSAATVAVVNASPTLTSTTLSASTVQENQDVTVSGSFTDAGAPAAHTVVVDWGDGSALTTLALPAGTFTFAATHRYADDNPSGTASDPYAMTVRVFDDVGDVVAAAPAMNRTIRFDGTTGTAVGAVTAAGAGGLATHAAVAVGPNGDLYVSGAAAGTNAVVRYNGATGAVVGTFVAAGAQGTTAASDLAFGPDGNLYYADEAGNRVLKFHGRTGAYLGLAASGGGLTAPRGLTFGPDGTLYVASFATDSVLRFDPATGTFLDAFVPAGTAGLDGPADLTFAADGDLYVLSALGSPAIRRYDGATGVEAGTFASVALSGPVGSLVAGPGHVLTVADPAGALQRFDLTTGDSLGTLPAAGAGALALLPRQAEATRTVIVQNVAPTVVVTNAANPAGAPATAQTLTATATDQGPLDTRTFAWTVTGGTAPSGAATPTFTFTPTGPSAVVTLTVTDDDGGTFVAKTQVVTGTTGNDTIAVTNTNVTVNGVATALTAGIARVVVIGSAGDDAISASAVTTLPVELIGGSGNDTLTGGGGNDLLVGNNPGDYALGYSGDTGNDALGGGAGNDTIDGGLGDDTLTGGTGNDTYRQVPGSADVLVEGADGFGIDTIDLQLAYRGVTLSLAYASGETQTVDSLGHQLSLTGTFENLVGSAFGDVLSGNAEDNVLSGGAGDDQLFGDDSLATTASDGNDLLIGGEGSDTIKGGAGNDALFGDDALATTAGDGNDLLVGGGGSDTIKGGAGNDALFGDDTLVALAGDGNDLLIGGEGSDTIKGGAGNDALFGDDSLVALAADGNDVLIGGEGSDTIKGGAGNDALFGDDTLVATASDGNDLLIGGEGSDTIKGGAGNDALFGDDSLVAMVGDGNDLLVGGEGSDTIKGGAGNDALFGDDSLVALAGDGNDLLVGGEGADTIKGGAGNDALFGDDSLVAMVGDGNDLLVGGGGSDTIKGGAGNDALFGDDSLAAMVGDGNDLLVGGGGSDTIKGGAGNDALFGDDTLVALAGDGNDLLVGGEGSDTIKGGAGNDALFGDDSLVAMAGDGNDLLVGGEGADTIKGGAGNDALFGNDSDDALTGGDGVDTLDGGAGLDRIVETADANVTLGATTLLIGLNLERFYDVEQAVLAGGVGANRLDATAFGGPVALFGNAGNDTLLGSAFADQLSGGSGDDSLVGGDGDDLLDPGTGNDAALGGAGNDTYAVFLGGVDVLTDTDGIDSIDLSSSAFAATIDLAVTGVPQVVDSAGSVLTFHGTFENLKGTSYDDDLRGDAGTNRIDGAGGQDRLDGRAGADFLRGSTVQLVYLDFDSATGPGEKAYSVVERNRIQARLEALYAAPFAVTFTQTAPSVGRYTTIVVNAGGLEENELLVGGQAYELDWRNVNAASRADINVNSFLGRKYQPEASSDNYVAFTATVIAHELGHLMGLRHHDSLGPIGVNPATGLPYGLFAGLAARAVSRNETVPGSGTGATLTYAFRSGPVLLGPVQLAGNAAPTPHPAPSGTVYEGTLAVATFVVQANGAVVSTPVGTPPRTVTGGSLDAESGRLTLTWSATPGVNSVVVSYDYDSFRPGYRGPDDATETASHVSASPSSVGSPITAALGNVYFGERELIKLAFADAGRSVPEAGLPTVAAPAALGGTARNLGTIPALAVPNLLPASAVNFGRHLAVRATSVVGAIGANGESDLYAVQGVAGDFLTVEILSATLASRGIEPFDPVLRVYDAAGNPVNYFGRPAENDDGFENQDSILLDIPLTATGTYYLRVAPFLANDLGSYELFAYSYSPPQAGAPRQGGAGDTVYGGPGADTLTGGVGDDRLYGTPGEDDFLGVGPDDATGNAAPAATVALAPASPLTNQTVTATATTRDDDGEPVRLTYRWYVGTTLVRTTTDTSALTDSLDLNVFGNGNRGDLVRVDVTPTDGLDSGTTVTASVTVGNTPPVAISGTVTTPEDTPLTAPAATDADGDALTYAVTQAPSHGTVTFNGDGTYTYTPAVNYNGGDTFTYRVNDGALDSSEATVTLTVTAVNDAPVALGGPATTAEDTAVTAPVATDVDTPVGSLSYTLTQAPAYGTVTFNADGTYTFTTTANYFGGDTFKYRVNDGSLDSAEATVTLTVTAVNDAPVALGGSVTTAEDTAVTAPVATDVDTPLGSLSYTLTQGPAHGTVTFNADGTYTYTPAANYFGGDTFKYRVNDGSLDSAEATVTLSVTPVNDAPVANGDSYSTNRATPLTVPAPGVLGNDTDVDGPGVTVTGHTAPAHGTLTLAADGSFTYVPVAGYVGPDSWTYTVSDGAGGASSATVALTVRPVFEVFVTGGATTLAEGSTTTFGSTVIDAAGAVSYAWAATKVGESTPAATGTNATFAFTPPDNGSYTIVLTATDGPSSGTVTRTLSVTNVAPSATVAATGPVAEGGSAVVSLSGVFDPSTADATAGFRYSFALTPGGLATTSAGADNAASKSFAFFDNGSYVAYARVYDKDGDFTDYSVAIEVTNVTPSVALSGAATVNEGSTYAVSFGPVADPGADAVTGYAVNWGDGTVESFAGSPAGLTNSHAYADGAPAGTARAVTVTLTDEDGPAVGGTLALTVTNVAQTVAITGGPGASVAAGTPVAFGSIVTDPGADAPFSYSWAVTRDGTPVAPGSPTTGTTFGFTPATAGAYVVTLLVTDKDGVAVTQTASFTATATTPSVTATVTPPVGLVRGASRPFQFGATGGSEPYSYAINWGDGSPVQTVSGGAAVTVPHAFPDDRAYVVSVVATAAGGAASAPATANVTVAIAAVYLDIDGRRVLAVGGSTGGDNIRVRLKEGCVDRLIVKVNERDFDYQFRGVFTDPANAPIQRLLIVGQGGNDHLRLDDDIEIDAQLFGDAGHDTLRGAGGDDLLVGGDGDDKLYGADGRDLLIGGRGADTLYGGDRQDILIAGYTDFDTDRTALTALMLEWASARTYEQRVANLGGTGTGTRNNGTTFLNDSTVHDDGVKDKVYGEGDRDWFLVNLDGPSNTRDETDRSGNEIWIDLDP